jgi:septal ring factor EnvC (AmiA/AmiB activator)
MEAGPPHREVKTPQEAAASPDPTEKLEGVRAWVEQLDRKLSTRLLALGAATVLALAAGIVAIVLALGVEDDSAKKSELSDLRDQVDDATRSASTAAEDEVADLEERLAEIETAIEGIRSDQTGSSREVSVVQDDVADLRDQVSELETAVEEAQAAAEAAGEDSDDSGGGVSP